MDGLRWCLSALVVSGCGFVSDGVTRVVTPLDDVVCLEATQRSVARREIYWDWEEPPKREFRRIARIEVAGPGSTETLLEELTAQAAACGATAIIDVEREETVEIQTYVFDDDEDVYHRTIVSGTAVRWLDLERGPAAHEVHGWDE